MIDLASDLVRDETGTEINAAPNPTKPLSKPEIVTAIMTTACRPSI
jgi:hypothetical protein